MHPRYDRTRRPQIPQQDEDSETRALRQQPGVPNRGRIQRQSEGRARRHQEPSTSAGDTTSFIHPRASRQQHENLRGLRRSKCAGATRQIETAYLEIKSSILGGRILRARAPDGVDQELHTLLITYKALRIAMTDATDSRPGTTPTGPFSLSTARDQLIQAAGVIADTVIDLVGTIGPAVLANLLPDRRIRTRPRIVKRAIFKYNAKGSNVDRTSYKATTSINVLTPPELTPSHRP